MYFQFLLNGVELSPENLHSIRLSGVAELSLRADYGAAMRRPHADLPLSERGGGEYLRLRAQRRDDGTHPQTTALPIITTTAS